MLLLFSSCQKAPSVIEKPLVTPIVTTPHGGQRDELDDRLYATINSIALGLLQPAQDSSFRNFVHAKAAEQFDEDDNVLLNEVQYSESETGIDLITEIRAGINAYEGQIIDNTLDFGITDNETTITGGVVAYPYDTDRTFYLQIYIPFIDEVDLSIMPVIAPEMDENYDGKIEGYQLNSNGSVSVIELTESYASTHLVWVVSINETVGNDGHPRGKLHKVETNTKHERATDFKEVFINKINISDKKDPWYAGKADISFIAVQTVGCGLYFDVAILSDCMKKVSNNDLNTWLSLASISKIRHFAFDPLLNQSTNNYFTETEFLHYIIYEQDANCNSNNKDITWSNANYSINVSGATAQCVTQNPSIPQQSHTYNYFSKDSPYWATDRDLPVGYNQLPQNSSNTIWNINNSGIGSGSGGQFELIVRKAYN